MSDKKKNSHVTSSKKAGVVSAKSPKAISSSEREEIIELSLIAVFVNDFYKKHRKTMTKLAYE